MNNSLVAEYHMLVILPRGMIPTYIPGVLTLQPEMAKVRNSEV